MALSTPDSAPSGVYVQGLDLIADGEDAVLIGDVEGSRRVLMRVRIGRDEHSQLHTFSQSITPAGMLSAPETRWPMKPLVEGRRT